MVSVRRVETNDFGTWRALRLRRLADSPDAFCGTLVNEQSRSVVDWQAGFERGVRSELDLPLMVESAGQPIGMALAKIEPASPAIANLYQMWVAPEARGAGAGRLLVETAVTWARRQGAREMRLGVTIGDTPAMRLYQRVGFEPVGAPEPLRADAELLLQHMRLALAAG